MADQPPAIPLVEPFSYNSPRSRIVFSHDPRTQICSTSSTADRLVEYPTHFSNVSFIGGKEESFIYRRGRPRALLTPPPLVLNNTARSTANALRWFGQFTVRT